MNKNEENNHLKCFSFFRFIVLKDVFFTWLDDIWFLAFVLEDLEHDFTHVPHEYESKLPIDSYIFQIDNFQELIVTLENQIPPNRVSLRFVQKDHQSKHEIQ